MIVDQRFTSIQYSFENLRLPYCNTVSYNKSCLPSTISLWNELPASTKTCPSVETFLPITYMEILGDLLQVRI
jgi:hypothetical protein